jgi:hypothetical protein
LNAIAAIKSRANQRHRRFLGKAQRISVLYEDDLTILICDYAAQPALA